MVRTFLKCQEKMRWTRRAPEGSAACIAFVHLSIGIATIFCFLLLIIPSFARARSRDKGCQYECAHRTAAGMRRFSRKAQFVAATHFTQSHGQQRKLAPRLSPRPISSVLPEPDLAPAGPVHLPVL